MRGGKEEDAAEPECDSTYYITSCTAFPGLYSQKSFPAVHRRRSLQVAAPLLHFVLAPQPLSWSNQPMPLPELPQLLIATTIPSRKLSELTAHESCTVAIFVPCLSLTMLEGLSVTETLNGFFVSIFLPGPYSEPLNCFPQPPLSHEV